MPHDANSATTTSHRPSGGVWFSVSCLLLALAVVGCTNTGGMPSGWGPLRLADDDRCPRVYGSYSAADADLAHILVTSHLPRDTSRAHVESFSLVLHDDSILTAIAWADREPRDTIDLKRGVHFACEDGWLQPDFPQRLPSYDFDTAGSRQWLSGRNHARVATGRDGALIVRVDHHTYDLFSIWAPGGAGIPLPWTWRVTRRWHRAVVVTPQTHRVSAPVRPLSPLDERLMREEA